MTMKLDHFLIWNVDVSFFVNILIACWGEGRGQRDFNSNLIVISFLLRTFTIRVSEKF